MIDQPTNLELEGPAPPAAPRAAPRTREPSRGSGENGSLMNALLRVMKDPKADPAKLDAAYNVMQRIQKDGAVRAFNAAMANAKGEIAPVIKNRQVDYDSGKGRTRYAYEDFAAVANAVDPAFAKFGLAYRFRVSQDSGVVRVTCIISHADGHSEENPMQSPPDTSGSKNAVQALGSVVTYLQRYSLKAALGLAATVDDDGRGGPDNTRLMDGDPVIDAEQMAYLQELLTTHNRTVEKVEQWAGCKLPEMRRRKFDQIVALLTRGQPS